MLSRGLAGRSTDEDFDTSSSLELELFVKWLIEREAAKRESGALPAWCRARSLALRGYDPHKTAHGR
jgi:hypothetical protein